ncbi:MAG: CHAD domain-containing protein [Desulfuromonadales bacterium]
MTLIPCDFYLPEGSLPEPVLASLASLGEFLLEPPKSLLRTYYDTFDWRLHAAGELLVEEQEPCQVHTCWRRIADHQLLGQCLTTVPRCLDELSSEPLRNSLTKLVDMRVLMPMTSIHLRLQRAALLNQERKTVLRLVFEDGKVDASADFPQQSLRMRLSLEPVKGYRKPFERACKLLQEQLELSPAGPLLDDALAVSGRKPQDYSGRLDVELHAGMPSGEALRVLLRHLLDTIERNLPGTIRDLDSEFLHDFRVAVRRTRSLLSQVKGVLPADVSRRFAAGFKWLGQISGATRDLDVYLLKLPGYRKSLPQQMQSDLQPLEDYLTRHQRREQNILAKQLDSARCRLLLENWQTFLETPREALSWPEKAEQPILAVANRKIWKAYRIVLREGLAINETSPPPALHELRISCKKLRYLLEFFQSLYPKKMLRRQIGVLKSLQDNLGDFHDLEVQADALRTFGHEMQSEQSDLPGEAFMAMGVLIDLLYRRQEIERRNFSDLFKRFAKPANQKACREMFKPVTLSKESL